MNYLHVGECSCLSCPWKGDIADLMEHLKKHGYDFGMHAGQYVLTKTLACDRAGGGER